MKIIIPECDKYIDFIEAKKYNYDKHCDQKLDVIVLGYKKPNCDLGDWNFVSLGEDTGIANYSNDLLRFFSGFNEEFFIFDNTDLLAVDKIDYDMMAVYEELFREYNAGRICITSAAEYHKRDLYSILEKRDGYEVLEHRQNADYRLALHASAWRTSYFLKYTKPNMDPWEMDLNGAAKNDGVKILGTGGRYFADVSHVFRLGELTKTWHYSVYTKKQMNKEDYHFTRDVVRKMGYK